MPPSDGITVYAREDIPDSIPTMAQYVAALVLAALLI
jgi:hypothetical protein